jgi:hypothetical protein
VNKNTKLAVFLALAAEKKGELGSAGIEQIAKLARLYDPTEWQRDQLAQLETAPELTDEAMEKLRAKEKEAIDSAIASSGTAITRDQEVALKQWYAENFDEGVAFLRDLRRTTLSHN